MRIEFPTRSADSIIGALADLQQGVVARRQLLEHGIGPDAIGRRVRNGRLRPIHRGVYLVGHRVAAPLAREMAAVLVCGSGAVVSHRSAAAMHRILPYPSMADIWLTLTTGDHRRRPGIRVSRAKPLDPRDVTRIHGVPVVTAARAVLEIAPVVDLGQLEQACAEAHARGLAHEPAIRDQLDRNPGRRGCVALRELLDRPHGPARTRSPLERRLLALVRSSDVREPQTNRGVCGFQVDMLWRRERLVVEADGRAFHSHARPWARDLERTNVLQLAGYTVLRFTWFDVTKRPHWTLEQIRGALARGSS